MNNNNKTLVFVSLLGLFGSVIVGDESLRTKSAATISSYSYTVSVQYYYNQNYNYVGTGALISSYYAVSSASCVNGFPESDLMVRLGSSLHSSGGLIVLLDSIVLHPDFNATTYDYDIAVLKLAISASLGASIGVITLPGQSQAVAAVANAVLTGWGGVAGECTALAQLQEAEIATLASLYCKSSYPDLYLSERMFCGQYVVSDTSCIADEGAPLAIDNQLVGLLSYHYENGLPIVFTSVSQFVEFINSVMDGTFSTTTSTTTTTAPSTSAVTTTTAASSSECSGSSNDKLLKLVIAVLNTIIEILQIILKLVL